MMFRTLARAIAVTGGLLVWVPGTLLCGQSAMGAACNEAEVAGAMPQPNGRALASADPMVMFQRGCLHAFGNAYKARFLDDAVEFVPALPQAPRNMAVRIELASIGRGDASVAVQPATIRRDGLRVEYVRPLVRERYDAVADGLEQSFVFERLPAGAGDLVVRCRLATELRVGRDGDGLSLELAGVGGMRIGGVTGIDARGRRTAGQVAFERGELQLSLPAAFVDGAVLPLVLDPLIGSPFHAFGTNLDDRSPAVAYDATNDVYLVVAQRRFSLSDSDIHGQRILGSGALVGSRIIIQSSAANEISPEVANVNLRDTFVVAYESGGDVYARGVRASDGGVSAELSVVASAGTQRVPDVGGEATLFDDDALCVWENTTSNRIEARQITVSAGGGLSAGPLTTLYASFSSQPRNPRISKGGGETGHHLVVFEHTPGPSGVDIAYVLVNRNLLLLQTLANISNASGNQAWPHVDGDGRHWVVAWQTPEPVVTTKSDIQVRTVVWDGAERMGDQGALLSNAIDITADPNDAEFRPHVVMTGGSALVSWSDQDGTSTFNTYFKSIDTIECTPCESAVQFQLDGPFGWDTLMAGCSKRSAGGNGDDALLTIESFDNSGGLGADIRAQRWHSEDGVVVDLGGGCGAGGGSIHGDCAIAGNSGFRVQLLSGRPVMPAWLIVSLDALGLPCNTCQLIPDPYSGFVQFEQTDASGRAFFELSIPSSGTVVGASLHLQWLVFEAVSPGCFPFTSDMTDGMRLTIE